jgi:hypothetical protein
VTGYSEVIRFEEDVFTACEALNGPEVGLCEVGSCRRLQRMTGKNLPKIASHSPFDEHILRRYFSLLDCAAGKQSHANPIRPIASFQK